MLIGRLGLTEAEARVQQAKFQAITTGLTVGRDALALFILGDDFTPAGSGATFPTSIVPAATTPTVKPKGILSNPVVLPLAAAAAAGALFLLR